MEKRNIQPGQRDGVAAARHALWVSGSMGIHDEYTDAEQLSNRNIWDEIW